MQLVTIHMLEDVVFAPEYWTTNQRQFAYVAPNMYAPCINQLSVLHAFKIKDSRLFFISVAIDTITFITIIEL